MNSCSAKIWRLGMTLSLLLAFAGLARAQDGPADREQLGTVESIPSTEIDASPWGIQFNILPPHLNVPAHEVDVDSLDDRIDTMLNRAEELGMRLNGKEQAVLQRIKELENQGFQFEAAEGSFEMLVRRSASDYAPAFELLDFTVIIEKRGDNRIYSQATTRVQVCNEVIHTAADGEGPVNALDSAIRKALLPYYPQLAEVRLVDYKVRIIDEHRGTAAKPRVLIESARGDERWSTIGASQNVIEASWQALWDSLELPLLRDAEKADGVTG